MNWIAKKICLVYFLFFPGILKSLEERLISLKVISVMVFGANTWNVARGVTMPREHV